MTAGGGTSLQAGFDGATQNLNSFLQKNAKSPNAENRIVMLTDVNDNFGPFCPVV